MVVIKIGRLLLSFLMVPSDLLGLMIVLLQDCVPVSLCCPGHSRERRGRSQSQSQSQPQKAQIDRRMDLRGHGWMDGRFDLLRLMHDLFWRFLVRPILLPLLLFALLLARSLHRWRYAVFVT